MRIIGGRLKGRRLASFRGLSIRPTSDKVREAVFNILPGEFPFRRSLDLFAGTGAMGIEALSRGAEEVLFVDNDTASVSVIRKNLDAWGLEARILKKDIRAALKWLTKKGETFDLIFIDPPYMASLMEDTLREVGGVACSGAYVVAETSKRAPVKGDFPGLELVTERKYGDTLVYIYRKKDGE